MLYILTKPTLQCYYDLPLRLVQRLSLAVERTKRKNKTFWFPFWNKYQRCCCCYVLSCICNYFFIKITINCIYIVISKIVCFTSKQTSWLVNHCSKTKLLLTLYWNIFTILRSQRSSVLHYIKGYNCLQKISKISKSLSWRVLSFTSIYFLFTSMDICLWYVIKIVLCNCPYRCHCLWPFVDFSNLFFFWGGGRGGRNG